MIAQDDDLIPPPTYIARIGHHTLISCDQQPNISALLSVSVNGFVFTTSSGCFLLFLPSTITLKIYHTFEHASRPYKLDAGEHSRYTTPYLKSYGLVGTSITRPALYVSLLSSS
ncbi:hypothetical protein GALMADRAFT_146921 [Galerina marginata CBS 339.88]|uniref:Uncharacterized protein n=1 Tax=Galerina marginata (strain CBS 339.88) TaxID=685588 RepID=A0A067S9Q8_GALM3|nr:hypothetical protein GALMADRAFT_146921 [Galerina marginata CBS 339.88]